MFDFGPGRQDFSYRKGNTFSVEIDWSIDLSGYSVTTELYSLVNGDTVASVGTAITDPSSGKLRVTFPPNVVPGTYGWRQTWQSSIGESRTGLAGYVEVLA